MPLNLCSMVNSAMSTGFHSWTSPHASLANWLGASWGTFYGYMAALNLVIEETAAATLSLREAARAADVAGRWRA